MNRGWKQGRMVGSTGRFILSLCTTSQQDARKKIATDLIRLNIPQVRSSEPSIALLDADLLVDPLLDVHNLGVDLLQLTGVRSLTLG
jgi:hypothetical protein